MDHRASAPDSTGAAIGQAFMLHDVFQFSFDAVSSVLGRSPVACRQRASRAPVAKTPLQSVMAGHITFASGPINGDPGAIALRNGLIQHIHAIANPYKLAYVTWMLQPNP